MPDALMQEILGDIAHANHPPREQLLECLIAFVKDTEAMGYLANNIAGREGWDWRSEWAREDRTSSALANWGRRLLLEAGIDLPGPERTRRPRRAKGVKR